MRIEQLRYVVTVADCHSLTLASEQLHISRQNVSKAIKQLEEELTIKIFRRSNQGVFLTPYGQKLYHYATDVLDKIAAIEKEFSENKSAYDSLQGVLKLNLYSTLLALLHKTIKGFNENYPLIQLELSIWCGNIVGEKHTPLNDEIYGLSILESQLSNLHKAYPEYQIYNVKDELLKVMLSKHNVLANQQSVSLKTLHNYPAILLDNELQGEALLNGLFLQKKMKPDIYMRTNDYNTALEFVSESNAYCFGSNYIANSMVQFANGCLAILPLSEKILLKHIVMLPKKLANKKVNQAFLDALKKNFGSSMVEV